MALHTHQLLNELSKQSAVNLRVHYGSTNNTDFTMLTLLYRIQQTLRGYVESNEDSYMRETWDSLLPFNELADVPHLGMPTRLSNRAFNVYLIDYMLKECDFYYTIT